MNLVSSHVNNVGSETVSTNNLLRVVPVNNARPGSVISFERMNDGGCLEVNDPTIDLVTLAFKNQDGDLLYSLGKFCCHSCSRLCHSTKAAHEEFFSWDK